MLYKYHWHTMRILRGFKAQASMRALLALLVAVHVCTATTAATPVVDKVTNSSWSSLLLPVEAQAAQVVPSTLSRPLNTYDTWNMTYPFDHDEFFRRLSIPKSSPKVCMTFIKLRI